MLKILVVGNTDEISAKVAVLKPLYDIFDTLSFKYYLYKGDTTTKIDGDTIYFESDPVNLKFVTRIRIDKHIYDLTDFDAVYWAHPSVTKNIYEISEKKHLLFLNAQVKTQLGILQNQIYYNRIPTINDIVFNQIQKDKAYQLKIANEVGLLTPNTLISNDPDKIRKFYIEHNKKIIVKTLSPAFIPDSMIFTCKVTPEYLEKLETTRYSPAIYQQLLDKEYEIRVIVVKNKIFAAKLDSQNLSDVGKTDWRRFNISKEKMEISKTTISRSNKLKIINFMRKMHLEYGALDFVVDQKSNLIFLEVNNFGQWAFIEKKTKQPIAKEIVKLLINKSKRINPLKPNTPSVL